MKGRDLFDASLFRDPTSTSVFYTFISKLKQSIDAAEPGPTHHFLQLLDTKKKLLRSYTQNIDGFEAKAGLLGSASHEAKSNNKGKSKIRTKDVRNVQLHGDIHRVRCRSCSAEYPCTPEYTSMFNEGHAPDCPECLQRCKQFLPSLMPAFSPISQAKLVLHALLVQSKSEHCDPPSFCTMNLTHWAMTLAPSSPLTSPGTPICSSSWEHRSKYMGSRS